MSAWSDGLISGEYGTGVSLVGKRSMKRAPAASVFTKPKPKRRRLPSVPLSRHDVSQGLLTAAEQTSELGTKANQRGKWICRQSGRRLSSSRQKKLKELNQLASAQFAKARRLQNKAVRWTHCHQRTHTKDIRVCPDFCEGEGDYVPHSCMVVGCPYCSKIQSRRFVDKFYPAIVGLWNRRESHKWRGRFWFYNFTMRVQEGETEEAATVRFMAAADKHLKWLPSYFGGESHGYIRSLEFGGEGLKRGRLTQVHAHVLLAIESQRQLSPKRLIVSDHVRVGQAEITIKDGLKVEHESVPGFISSVRSDFEGEYNKRLIESNWVDTLGDDCPVSRIYEIAPAGLPLNLNAEQVEESLRRTDCEDVAKMTRVNINATLGQAARELLKYVTKTADLDAAALVKVIVALDGKRRIKAAGLFARQSLRDLAREGLEGLRAAELAEGGQGGQWHDKTTCPVCQQKKVLKDSDGLPNAAVASALRSYLERRAWVEPWAEGQAYGLIPCKQKSGQPGERRQSLGPPTLLDWLAELETSEPTRN